MQACNESCWQQLHAWTIQTVTWLQSNITCIIQYSWLVRYGCNLFDVISIYSLNLGKLPGRFSYERPGYEANVHHETSSVLLDQAQLEMLLCLVQYIHKQVHVHVDVWYR